jgi:proliferating cell nuclear antigen
MLVKLENPELLSKAIDLISELVTEVRLKVNEKGMGITAMDPANVSLIGFKLPRSAFSQYELDSNEQALGINLDNLKRVLKRAGKKSSLTLEKKENRLSIEIIDKVKRNFTISLIEVESEDIDFNEKVSRMEFSSKVEIDSVDLITSIEDCAVIGDACSFIIKEGKFIIETKSLNSSRTEFSGDEAKIDAEDCKARYSLEYLQKFSKGSKISDKTTLNFAQDHPLRYDIHAENMEISFILAPRVETED